MALKPHEIEDGATEAVSRSPRRRASKAPSVGEVADSPVGGKMAQMRLKKAQNGGDFIAIRSPAGAARIVMGHMEVFRTVWRLWASKRALGDDSGVTVADIARHIGESTQKVGQVLKSLVKNGVIRAVVTVVGFQGTRAAYSPTELGTQLLALAETFGQGVSITIGRTATAWRSKAEDEPDNFFIYAALLSGKKG